MKKYIILIFFLIAFFNSVSLNPDPFKVKCKHYGSFFNKNRLWGCTVGYNFALNAVDVGVIRTSYSRDCPKLDFKMAAASISTELIPQLNMVGPKIAFEQAFYFLAFKTSLINYTDLKQNTLILRPQFGFTFIGLFNLLYGYNIKLDKAEINIPKQVLTISVNWPLSG